MFPASLVFLLFKSSIFKLCFLLVWNLFLLTFLLIPLILKCLKKSYSGFCLLLPFLYLILKSFLMMRIPHYLSMSFHVKISFYFSGSEKNSAPIFLPISCTTNWTMVSQENLYMFCVFVLREMNEGAIGISNLFFLK